MLSCTDFIPAYSELFKFIEEHEGYNGVRSYWKYLSDEFLIESLGKAVAEKGLEGCFDYWEVPLNEEAADFTLTFDPDVGEFTIEMHYCPSKGRLIEFTHIEPYHDYCGHCDLLYRNILEKYGFEYYFDTQNCDKASCFIRVTDPDFKKQVM